MELHQNDSRRKFVNVYRKLNRENCISLLRSKHLPETNVEKYFSMMVLLDLQHAQQKCFFFLGEDIEHLEKWTTQSPYLNIIETLLEELKRQMLPRKPRNLQELCDCCRKKKLKEFPTRNHRLCFFQWYIELRQLL